MGNITTNISKNYEKELNLICNRLKISKYIYFKIALVNAINKDKEMKK